MRHKHRMPTKSLVKEPSSYEVCGQFIGNERSIERKTRTWRKSRAVDALMTGVLLSYPVCALWRGLSPGVDSTLCPGEGELLQVI